METKIDRIHFEDLVEQTGLAKTPYDRQVAYLTRDLLLALGEDPEREGLQRTPERVARMYEELLSGYHADPIALVNGALFESAVRDMVVVRDIEYHSLCEHHLLPFLGKAHVAYLPNGKIIGLSKIPRLVDAFSRRFQLQERMTQQIAESLMAVLRPRGVAVLVEGTHLCALMRGVQKAGASMVTTAFLGEFERSQGLREEFIAHLQRPRGNPLTPVG